MIRWLLESDAGLVVGSLLIWAGIIALAGLLISRFGDVRMGPEDIPASEAPTALLPVVPAEPIQPNYIPVEEWYPLAGYLTAALDAAADATVELAQVVEVKPVDPLDVTVELETVDPSVPLFYQIRRPGPYVAESFTQGIERAQIERALAAGSDG